MLGASRRKEGYIGVPVFYRSFVEDHQPQIHSADGQVQTNHRNLSPVILHWCVHNDTPEPDSSHKCLPRSHSSFLGGLVFLPGLLFGGGDPRLSGCAHAVSGQKRVIAARIT